MTSCGLAASVSVASTQASRAVRAVALRSARSFNKAIRRSPTTRSVVSVTMQYTPPTSPDSTRTGS